MTESVSEVKVNELACVGDRLEESGRKLAEDVEESHFTTGQEEEEELSVQTAALVVVVAGLFVVLSD